MPDHQPVITKITLNEEQTRRFLSFFIPEVLQMAKEHREQREAQETQLTLIDLETKKEV